MPLFIWLLVGLVPLFIGVVPVGLIGLFLLPVWSMVPFTGWVVLLVRFVLLRVLLRLFIVDESCCAKDTVQESNTAVHTTIIFFIIFGFCCLNNGMLIVRQ